MAGAAGRSRSSCNQPPVFGTCQQEVCGKFPSTGLRPLWRGWVGCQERLPPKQVLNFQAPGRVFTVNKPSRSKCRNQRFLSKEARMPKGFAAARSALVTELDRTETTQVLEAARALIEVDPRKLSWRDHTMLAAYVALHRPDRDECHRLLAHSLAASPIASQAFARFPTQMAELCIEALRSGTET